MHSRPRYHTLSDTPRPHKHTRRQDLSLFPSPQLFSFLHPSFPASSFYALHLPAFTVFFLSFFFHCRHCLCHSPSLPLTPPSSSYSVPSPFHPFPCVSPSVSSLPSRVRLAPRVLYTCKRRRRRRACPFANLPDRSPVRSLARPPHILEGTSGVPKTMIFNWGEPFFGLLTHGHVRAGDAFVPPGNGFS